MKTVKNILIHGFICCIGFSGLLTAAELKAGIGLDAFDAAMNKHGYKLVSCGDMGPKSRKEDIKCYVVGEHNLIVAFGTANRTVKRMTYYLSDGRAKSERTMFFLKVIAFDPETGEMRLATKGK